MLKRIMSFLLVAFMVTMNSCGGKKVETLFIKNLIAELDSAKTGAEAYAVLRKGGFKGNLMPNKKIYDDTAKPILFKKEYKSQSPAKIIIDNSNKYYAVPVDHVLITGDSLEYAIVSRSELTDIVEATKPFNGKSDTFKGLTSIDVEWLDFRSGKK
jgi:hypothetical protein